MPSYEGLSHDKHSVVIEIGNAYTKCGFVQDFCPRAIFRSEVFCKQLNSTVNLMSIKDEKQLREALKSFLEIVYFRYLAVNPKERRVILVEHLFTGQLFRKILIDILFKQLDIPALLILPQHLVTLMSLMIPSGLIVDVGYNDSLVIPVIEGVTLIDSVQFNSLGAKCIHEMLAFYLKQSKCKLNSKDGLQEMNEDDFNSLNEKFYENLKVHNSAVVAFEHSTLLSNQNECVNGKYIHLPLDGDRKLQIPRYICLKAMESVFNSSETEITLPMLILDSLLAAPIDSRKFLASNIVLIGGTTMLPGFRKRIDDELNYLINNNEKYKGKIFFNEFKFHNLPCKANYAAWLGAAIFGSTDAINSSRIVQRENYLTGNVKQLLDWCDFYPENKFDHCVN